MICPAGVAVASCTRWWTFSCVLDSHWRVAHIRHRQTEKCVSADQRLWVGGTFNHVLFWLVIHVKSSVNRRLTAGYGAEHCAQVGSRWTSAQRAKTAWQPLCSAQLCMVQAHSCIAKHLHNGKGCAHGVLSKNGLGWDVCVLSGRAPCAYPFPWHSRGPNAWFIVVVVFPAQGYMCQKWRHCACMKAPQTVLAPCHVHLNLCNSVCAVLFISSGTPARVEAVSGRAGLQKTHIAVWLNTFCIHILVII